MKTMKVENNIEKKNYSTICFINHRVDSDSYKWDKEFKPLLLEDIKSFMYDLVKEYNTDRFIIAPNPAIGRDFLNVALSMPEIYIMRGYENSIIKKEIIKHVELTPVFPYESYDHGQAYYFEKVYLSENAHNSQARTLAFQKCERYMIDNSDLVVAVSNGYDYKAITYAKSLGKPLILLNVRGCNWYETQSMSFTLHSNRTISNLQVSNKNY